MKRYFWLPLVGVILLLSGASPAISVAGSEPIGGIQGDVNCDDVVNSVDSLQILRSVAGLSTSAACLVDAGDVNCGDAVNSVDSLQILRYVAGLAVTAPDGCAGIGEPLEIGPAAQLAAQLYAATDDEARYQALLDVMEALRIGVYTSEGGEVQQGAERGVGDFYLYDFELRMLAAGLGRRDNSWGVQQIADTLDQVGYREDGEPFTADNLNQILHEATNDSLATPDEASSLVPLLVRELGLRHESPYDLADDLDVNEARFDGLQTTLILVGLTLQVIAEEGPVDAPASTLVANSNGILAAQPVGLTGPCSDFKSEGQELWPATKFFLTAVAVVSTIGKRVVAFIDIVHGEQLALSVRVKALEKVLGPTHYDHGSGSPGENLKFRIEVRMLDDLGEFLVECGWLATADYPPKGPIAGVRVQFNAYSSYLEQHGTLDCTGVFCSRTTGPDGIATLTFDPKSENEPYGQGDLWDVGPGSLDAIAWYQSRFKNLFGTLAQFVTPKGDEFTWSLSYHGCPPAGSAAQLVNGAPRAAAASSGVPCAYEGTASATHNVPPPNGSVLRYTITASNLRFERKPNPAHPDGATYELVRGTVTVEATGEADDCTISGGYTIPQPMDDGVHIFGGSIAVDPQKNNYNAAGGVGDYEEHVFIYCPDQPPVSLGTVGHLWVRTTNSLQGIPDRPFTPGDPLQGTFDTQGGIFPDWTSHYEWNFEPIYCSPSPQPICQ